MDVPVLVVRASGAQEPMAAMLVCCMHPTVLHEDSTLVSGDFPAMAREYLQKNVLAGCPVLLHTGPQGNQSPRHVTSANTFEEAERIGTILGKAVDKVIPSIRFQSALPLAAAQDFVQLAPRDFPPVEQAERGLQKAIQRLDHLRKTGAPHAQIRTAECDWFGAEETLTLSKAAAGGALEAARKAVMPAEIQVFTIGPWKFVGWPGEMFVEFGLAVRRHNRNAFVIALANGEVQGYIVTPAAAAEGGYEASNALFAPESGNLLVQRTLEMIRG
jgi:hypothetical protein